jgi:hypothetical protein
VDKIEAPLQVVSESIPVEAILAFQTVFLARTQFEQKPDRSSIALGLHQCHVAGLSQGHFGTGEL